MTDPQQQALPPLPTPDTHCWDDDTGKDVWSYSEGLMRAYAADAVACALAAAVPRPFAAVKSLADSVLSMLDERIKVADGASHPFADYFGDHPEFIVAAKAQASELREVRTQVRILGDRALTQLSTLKRPSTSVAEAGGTIKEDLKVQAVAWRWWPSDYWREFVITQDPKRAEEAKTYGLKVEALGVIKESEQ